MNQKSLFATMRNIVMKATGVRNVYFSDQPNHAPSGEYATIRIASDIDQTAVGAMKHKYSSVDRSVTVTMKVPVTYRVTINFYRGEAIANATKLIGCYRLPSIHADLLRANLGWGGHQPVQNLTALQSNRQEQRSAIVVTLVGEEVASEVVNSIEATRLTVEDEKTNVLIDTDIPSDKLHGVSQK